MDRMSHRRLRRKRQHAFLAHDVVVLMRVHGISRAHAELVVQAMRTSMRKALMDGRTVSLFGLGSVRLRDKDDDVLVEFKPGRVILDEIEYRLRRP